MLIKFLSLYLFAGILMLSIMFVYSLARGKSDFSKVLGALAVSIDIYLLGYLLEINMNTLDELLFWNQIQYFGIPFFPAFWLLVSLLYTGRLKKLWSLPTAFILIIPIITFIMRATNSMHYLYYSQIYLNHVNDSVFMVLNKGPWYIIQMVYVLITLVISSWTYYQRYSMSDHVQKKQFGLLLSASTLPYIALLFVGLNVGNSGIDFTAIVLPPSVLIINYALANYNFLEIKLMARDRVFEDSQNGLILLDHARTIKDFNPASIKYFDQLQVKLSFDSLDTLLAPHAQILEELKKDATSLYKFSYLDEMHQLAFTSSDIWNYGELIGVLLSIEDVTVKEQLNEQLREMARTDVLTELNNRRFFVQEAEKALERIKRYPQPLALLMIDIDFFKKINDTYGHVCGDLALKSVADQIRASFRGSDVIGRIGGEEFAILMIDSTPEKAFQKAEMFRSSIEQMNFVYNDSSIPITVSIGISQYKDSNCSLDDLVTGADHAMYRAKEQGRNCVVVDA